MAIDRRVKFGTEQIVTILTNVIWN